MLIAARTTSQSLAPLAHGGNLATARAMFPNAIEPFIDLSTGINPWPYPVPDNAPIEGWPVEGGTLDNVQRNGQGDRHLLVVDPVNRMLYEFFVARKTQLILPGQDTERPSWGPQNAGRRGCCQDKIPYLGGLETRARRSGPPCLAPRPGPGGTGLPR